MDDFYASSRVFEPRSVQDNLMIELFAKKHGLTIQQVEEKLEELEVSKRRKLNRRR